MAEPRTLPPDRDPLGATLHQLQLAGTLYCRADLTAPWGIDIPALDDCMILHVVTTGRCWLEVGDDEPVLVEAGGVALVPHGAGHVMRSAPGAPATPLFDIPVETLSERSERIEHGGGGEPTQTLCVVVRFDQVAAARLVAQLPRVLRVDAWTAEDDDWLRSTLRFLAREARDLRPGGEAVLTRLADILVVQLIRRWLDTAPEPETGWLAALRDPHLGRALAALHQAPAHPWTVAELAEVAALSRSAFAARFTDVVGEPVMRYLTRWRLQLAREQLRKGDEPLVVLAERCGYRSEAAFCRAFKREFGLSPGRARREAAAAAPGADVLASPP